MPTGIPKGTNQQIFQGITEIVKFKNYFEIMTEPDLINITKQFSIKGDIISIQPYGDGLINWTYLVETKSKSGYHRYILQKINQYVFPEPWKVMFNLSIIDQHIQKKREQSVVENFQTVECIETKKKLHIPLVELKNDFWRMMKFIPETRTLKTAETPEIAFEAARAFGKFDYYFHDLNPKLIYMTIPGYHGYKQRIRRFDSAIRKDAVNRVSACTLEIKESRSRLNYLDHMVHLLENKIIPKRVTHNDTKIDNVLFEKHRIKATGVIDLDTVMPANVLYDFGDMVRFNCNSTREDEADISKIEFKEQIFKSMAEGYLEETQDFITDNEKANLVFGGLFYTWIQAIRFLTDYLMGDVYYKTGYPEHNLDRTKNQLEFLKQMEERRKDLERIIMKS